MISIIITAWREAKTVRKLIYDLELQIQKLNQRFEILLVCPDEETKNAGQSADLLGILQCIKDEQNGKPAALNLAFKEARGNIWILTDGDVEVADDAIETLLAGFKIEKLGAVTGHPVPQNSRYNLFGYWSHLLTEAGAHRKRLMRKEKDAFMTCSGYWFAIRSGIVKEIPKNTLADDALISHLVWNAGYKIDYAPKSIVKVSFPTNFSDWLKQKKRSAGGYAQLSCLVKVDENMRTFVKESGNVLVALSYAKSLKELWWTVLLILARLYLWLAIFWEQKITHKSFEDTWVRIESTK